MSDTNGRGDLEHRMQEIETESILLRRDVTRLGADDVTILDRLNALAVGQVARHKEILELFARLNDSVNKRLHRLPGKRKTRLSRTR